MNGTLYISIDDAAVMLNVDRWTIQRLIKDGSLPAYRIPPKLVRIDIEDVRALLVPIPVGANK